LGVVAFYFIFLAGEPQNAVQRFGLINPGAFRHTPAGSACRRHQGDLSLGMQAAVDLQNCFQHGCLAGARGACDDGKIVAIGCIHSRFLF